MYNAQAVKRPKRKPCDFCDGSLEGRTVTVDWRRRGRLLVIENVPALVCNRCGERYYAATVMREMEQLARRRARRTIKVPVAKFPVVA